MIKVKIANIVLIFAYCLIASGCFYAVAAGVGVAVGALGGYAISKDTIQGETDKSYDSLWNSTLEVLGVMGTVETEDKQKGTIEAMVDGSDVNIKIEQLTTKTSRMRVSARKYMMPDIKLAQKIYTKTMERAK